MFVKESKGVVFEIVLVNTNLTSKHSSRMRTARLGGHHQLSLPGGYMNKRGMSKRGLVCPEGVGYVRKGVALPYDLSHDACDLS